MGAPRVTGEGRRGGLRKWAGKKRKAQSKSQQGARPVRTLLPLYLKNLFPRNPFPVLPALSQTQLPPLHTEFLRSPQDLDWLPLSCPTL